MIFIMENEMIFIEATGFQTNKPVYLNINKIECVTYDYEVPSKNITRINFQDGEYLRITESYEEVKSLIKKAIQERPIRDIRMEIPNDNITDIVNLIMKEIRNEISTKE